MNYLRNTMMSRTIGIIPDSRAASFVHTHFIISKCIRRERDVFIWHINYKGWLCKASEGVYFVCVKISCLWIVNWWANFIHRTFSFPKCCNTISPIKDDFEVSVCLNERLLDYILSEWKCLRNRVVLLARVFKNDVNLTAKATHTSNWMRETLFV